MPRSKGNKFEYEKQIAEAKNRIRQAVIREFGRKILTDREEYFNALKKKANWNKIPWDFYWKFRGDIENYSIKTINGKETIYITDNDGFTKTHKAYSPKVAKSIYGKYKRKGLNNLTNYELRNLDYIQMILGIE